MKQREGLYAGAPVLACLMLVTAPAAAQNEGEQPEPQAERPEVAAIPEVGGVLTPPGRWVIEPSLQFSNSQVNRFTFLGVEILDTFLIGVIEAEDVDRDVFSPALDIRTGITRRLEVSVKIPYVYREERRSGTIPQLDAQDPVSIEQEVDGDGLGDVELGIHFQMNDGPSVFYVANLRYKSTTGEGPFEISYDADGLEREAATGSGFHGIEPSLTVLAASDPAVFYANVGYLFNLGDDVDTTIGAGDSARTIGYVDPGDALRLSFGMSLAVNPKAAVSFGYKHDFIRETESEINGVEFRSSSLDVGSLLLGFSHALGARSSLAANLELGITADAPDVTVTIRLPFVFGD